MHATTVYRKGFGLGREIGPALQTDYHSELVEWFRHHGGRLEAKDTTLLLAAEFGFCYGVERAVAYAYEARRQFPERQLHITGEIIHNPHVNKNLKEMGIHFLSNPDNLEIDVAAVARGDVVILPAFGARSSDLEALEQRGAVLVDTTCGSVLNVWKNVQRNAQDGFTSIIHGKVHHEETRATASWAMGQNGRGRYLVVRDMAETEQVCGYIERGGSRNGFLDQFGTAASPDFDPDLHLKRIGVANQTTMLSSESMAIARRLAVSLERRYGRDHRERHFRSFDTICSATQERQDAVIDLLRQDLNILVVIGGYNSSNTNHLAELAAQTSTRTYHIQTAGALQDEHCIRYKPVGRNQELIEADWLPAGPLRLGVTAGASTPNNRIGEVLQRLLDLRGMASPLPGGAEPVPSGTP
ncbi:MAG: 4-hydroxy-3-methylbut-2-enyl diphosphate reductase [Acidobacteriota bacterium]